MWISQLFGGVYGSKIFDGCMSVKNIWGVYTPQIYYGCMSVKYLGGLHLQNIRRMYVRQIFGASTPPKQLTDVCYQIFGGSTPPKYLTDVDPSTIWGVYTSKIFDGRMSLKYLGGLHLQNI